MAEQSFDGSTRIEHGITRKIPVPEALRRKIVGGSFSALVREATAATREGEQHNEHGFLRGFAIEEGRVARIVDSKLLRGVGKGIRRDVVMGAYTSFADQNAILLVRAHTHYKGSFASSPTDMVHWLTGEGEPHEAEIDGKLMTYVGRRPIDLVIGASHQEFGQNHVFGLAQTQDVLDGSVSFEEIVSFLGLAEIMQEEKFTDPEITRLIEKAYEAGIEVRRFALREEVALRSWLVGHLPHVLQFQGGEPPAPRLDFLSRR